MRHPVREALERIEKKMATQAEIDGLTAKLQEIQEGLTTAETNIKDKIAELEKKVEEGGSVTSGDLSKLSSEVDALGTTASEVDSIAQTPPVAAEGSAPAGQGVEGQAPTRQDGTAVDAQP